MTDPKEKIDRDLADYVSMEEHLNNGDRLKLLKGIFNRHLIEKSTLHLINDSDILVIDTLIKNAYSNLSLPIWVGNRKMGYDDLRTIANAEGMLGYLNLIHLTNKEIVINYKKV